MSKFLIIKWDTNDADYIYNIVNISKLETESKPYWVDIDALLEKWIKTMKEKQIEMWTKYWNNWWISEYSEKTPEEVYGNLFTENEISWINDCFVPHWFEGIHDIVSIDIIEGDMTRLFTYRLG